MADTEIILNDCFKTKRAKVSNIAKCFKNAVSQTNNPIKETLTFNLNDLTVIDKFPAITKQVSIYDYNLYKDPRNLKYQDDIGTRWNLYKSNYIPYYDSASDKYKFVAREYVDTDNTLSSFSGYENLKGLHIACIPHADSSYNGFPPKHYIREYNTLQDIQRMFLAKYGETKFTIAIPSVALIKSSLENPETSNYIDPDFLKFNHLNYRTDKDNPTLKQRNFIQIGAEETDKGIKYNSRFLLFFENIIENPKNYISESGYNYDVEPGVYVTDLTGTDLTNDNNFRSTTVRHKISYKNENSTLIDWDGNSLLTFYFTYQRINEQLIGKLEVENVDGTRTLIKNNISPSQTPNTPGEGGANFNYTWCSRFGAWNNIIYNSGWQYRLYKGKTCNMIIKDITMSYTPFSEFTLKNNKKINVYNYDLPSPEGIIPDNPGTLISPPKRLINDLINEYTYNINATYGTVNWFYGEDTDIIDNKIIISPSDLTEHNTLPLVYFQKKDKEIKVIADKNSITTFENPNKNIYKINLSELESLYSLDLSDNELISIDLSNNNLLHNINLSNNYNLKEIIWPKGFLAKNDTYDINLRNTLINTIEFISVPTDPKDIKCKLDLKISLVNDIIKLNLQGISLINPDTCDIVNANFRNVKEVNISETNLLSKKTRLEKFLNNLPDRTGKEPGIIYMYGKKYTYEGVQGSAMAITDTLENLKNKNWLFYL